MKRIIEALGLVLGVAFAVPAFAADEPKKEDKKEEKSEAKKDEGDAKAEEGKGEEKGKKKGLKKSKGSKMEKAKSDE